MTLCCHVWRLTWLLVEHCMENVSWCNIHPWDRYNKMIIWDGYIDWRCMVQRTVFGTDWSPWRLHWLSLAPRVTSSASYGQCAPYS